MKCMRVLYFLFFILFYSFFRRAIVPFEMAFFPIRSSSPKYSGYGAAWYGRLKKKRKKRKSLGGGVRLGKLLTERKKEKKRKKDNTV